jgi:hypothetical protein
MDWPLFPPFFFFFSVYNVWVHKTGDEVPPSTFSLTNVEEWDRFRNIDMDKEVIFLSLSCRSFPQNFHCLRKQFDALEIGFNKH